jgi:preprotein translocase subunit SecG
VKTYLEIVEIVVSAFLIVMLIAQSRGSGFTGTSQDQTTVFRTRRGIEKTLFQATMVLAVLFIVVAIASSLLTRL